MSEGALKQKIEEKLNIIFNKRNIEKELIVSENDKELNQKDLGTN